MQKKNFGFGVVEVLVIVVAILIVGYIGWRAYETGKSKTSTQTDSQSNTGTSRQTNAPAGSADVSTYLDVKELGVKIKLDSGVMDATYAVQTLSDGSLVARFSTQSFAALDPACDAQSGQLGALERSTTDIDRLGNKLVPDGKEVFKFGNYYFTYATSQALCSAKVQSAVGAAMEAFRSSLTTLQSD